jgi:multidrug efflux pump subunit AcrB
MGVALALLEMAAFLRDLRAGLAAAVALPTTLLATFASMRLFHQSLNLMSLGGLAVAIGLVIDDAIVIVEAIVRRLEEGLSPLVAARAGTGDLLGAVTGTTITTVVVFAPLGLLEGVIGTFFGSLATTLCAAVLLSLLFAVTLVPLVAGWLLKARAPKDREARRRAFGSGYGRLLSSLVRRPLWVLPALVLLFAGGAVALTHMATGLLPPLDEGSFVLDFYLPPGTSLAETDRAVHRIDAVLARDPSVETFTRRTGAEMGPITATVQNRGDIMVRLVSRDRRPPIDDVIARVREELADAVPEVDVEFVQVLADVLDDLSGTARPIEVHVSGDDPLVLEQVATEVGRRLEHEPRLADVFDGVEGQVPALRLAVDPNAVQRFGVDPEHIGEDVRVMAEGRVVAQLRLEDRAYGIRVRFPDAVRFEANALLRVPLATDRGSLPLSSLVRVDRPLTPSARSREQLRPTVIVTGDVPDGDLGAAEAAVHKRLADVALPPGVTVNVAGKAAGARAAREQLLHVLGLGAALLLLVLVAQLRSFRLALLVLSSAPVGLVGALSTLALTGTALDVSSLMGCVLLAGLVVKNGILLLEHAQHRADEVGFAAALVEAGARRLRPILMTTLATLAGLAPLALGLGAGSELQRPLALAVIGGLVVSTAVTLLALPPLAALSMRGKLEREVP